MRGACAILAAAVLALGGLSGAGEWDLELGLAAAERVKATASLTLRRKLGGWGLAGRADYAWWGEAAGGWAWQEFATRRTWGPLRVRGTLLFGPQAPALIYAQLILDCSLGGVDTSLHLASLGDGVGTPFPGAGAPGAVVTARTKVGRRMWAAAVVELGASLPPGGFTIHHNRGLTKVYSTCPLAGVGTVCGAEFSLQKEIADGAGQAELRLEPDGVRHLRFSLWGLPLGPLPFTVGQDKHHPTTISLTASGDQLAVAPTFRLFGPCLRAYASATWDQPAKPAGVTVHGVGVNAAWAGARFGCLAALETQHAWWVPADGTASEYVFHPQPPARWHDAHTRLWAGDERTLVWLAADGRLPGGGSYTAEVDWFFSPSGGLWGWSRAAAGLRLAGGDHLSLTARLLLTPTGWQELSLRLALQL
ncbi:MAG: hypothetical protein ACP5G2_06255 [Candidatus Bipolaricaulaceae bacterium]